MVVGGGGDCCSSQKLLEKSGVKKSTWNHSTLLLGVTEFCLEAFPTVAVNNAAAFLQAVATHTHTHTHTYTLTAPNRVTGTNLETMLSVKWHKMAAVVPQVGAGWQEKGEGCGG